MYNRGTDIAQSNDFHPAEVLYSPPILEVGKLKDVLHRRMKMMIIIFILVLAIGAVYTITTKPVYESTALLMVAAPQAVSSNSGDPGLMSDLAALTKNRSVKSQAVLLTSPTTLKKAVATLGQQRIREGYSEEQLPTWALDVKQAEDTDVISVTAKSYSPSVSCDLAEFVCSTYIDSDMVRNSEATRQARRYVSSELKTVQKQLASARKELADFKRSTRLIVTDEQIRALAQNELSLESELDKARVELASANSEKGVVQAQLRNQGTEIQESRTLQISPQYQEAMLALGKLYTDRAALVQEYTPDSKEIRQIEDRIAKAEQQMKRFADKIVSSKVRARNPLLDKYIEILASSSASAAKVNALNKAVSSRNRQLDKLPDQERTGLHLVQKVGNLDRTYDMLSSKYYTLMINEKSLLPNAHIVSDAQLPIRPVSPDKGRNAIRFSLLAVLVSIGCVWAAEKLDRKVRDEATFVEMIGGPPLAAIPESKQPRLRTSTAIVRSQKNDFLEAFRLLRNNILLSLDHPMSLIAVTSPGRGEGKSTTAVNLAASVAMTGKRVLIADCDFRRPSLHKYLGLPVNLGLSDILKGSASLDEAILETEFKNMYCIPAGAFLPDASEVLQSEAGRSPFAGMAHGFDMIILDCPPCSGLSDMQAISQIVDGVILVVSIDHTARYGIYDGLLNLQRVDAPIIGYVANRLDFGKRDLQKPMMSQSTENG